MSGTRARAHIDDANRKTYAFINPISQVQQAPKDNENPRLLTSDANLRSRWHISRADQIQQARNLWVIGLLQRVTALSSAGCTLRNWDWGWRCRNGWDGWDGGDGWSSGTWTRTREPWGIAPALVGNGSFGSESRRHGEDDMCEFHVAELSVNGLDGLGKV